MVNPKRCSDDLQWHMNNAKLRRQPIEEVIQHSSNDASDSDEVESVESMYYESDDPDDFHRENETDHDNDEGGEQELQSDLPSIAHGLVKLNVKMPVDREMDDGSGQHEDSGSDNSDNDQENTEEDLSDSHKGSQIQMDDGSGQHEDSASDTAGCTASPKVADTPALAAPLFKAPKKQLSGAKGQVTLQPTASQLARVIFLQAAGYISSPTDSPVDIPAPPRRKGDLRMETKNHSF